MDRIDRVTECSRQGCRWYGVGWWDESVKAEVCGKARRWSERYGHKDRRLPGALPAGDAGRATTEQLIFGMNGRAYYVRFLAGYQGDTRLYRLEPVLEWCGSSVEYVVVQAVGDLWGAHKRQAYVAIYPADNLGQRLQVERMARVDGDSHRRALAQLGYEMEL